MEIIKLDPASAFDKAIESRNGEDRIVVCGSMDTIKNLQEGIAFNETPDETIRSASEKINASDWFELKEKELKAELEEDEFDFSETLGEWPGEIEESMAFTLASDILSGKLLDDVSGIKMKSNNSAEVLLSLKYGGWNDCPSTEEQMAIWRYWEKKYGAKIVGVGHDIIEAYVENPPKTQEEAMALAHEQYSYCYDIVDQGCETIANLAATLQNSQVWYFWWD